MLQLAEDFQQFSVDKTPFEEGEPDADEGYDWNQTFEPTEILYGKRLESHQADPISLLESRAGRKAFEQEHSKKE